MAPLQGLTQRSGSGLFPRGGCWGLPCATTELLARHRGAPAPGRPPGPCLAAIWSNIQGLPCFQKLVRDKERSVNWRHCPCGGDPIQQQYRHQPEQIGKGETRGPASGAAAATPVLDGFPEQSLGCPNLPCNPGVMGSAYTGSGTREGGQAPMSWFGASA